jgi:formylglycine-generating enzyme required for sulfatase activity/predicted Ser/Thr protein kinase
MIDINQIIDGRFRVASRIGDGAMGEVYRGLDTQTNEPVAIKVLKQDLVRNDPDVIERFAREGEVLRMLDHPNIVKMLASIVENAQHYIVMEYVGGGSLDQLLKREKQLQIDRVLDIGIGLCDALARAHGLKVVHRDIKPQNVLLAEDGAPRLTDFGVAHMSNLSSITQSGALIGTFPYISPETWNYEEPDERTDIWSLGIMLYEMLVGRRPFHSNQPARIKAAVLRDPAPPLHQSRADAPLALANLIDHMLEKDRERRIPSVRLVAAELESIARGASGLLASRLKERTIAGAQPGPPAPAQAGAAPARTPDVDLTVISTEAGYAVQLRSSFAIDAPRAQPFELPFDRAALARQRRNIAEWIKQARITRLSGNDELRLAREFGSALFERLFTGPVLEAFRGSRAALPPGERLRLRLRLPDALTLIPWELLYDPSAQKFLALEPDLTLVRYPEQPASGARLRVNGPLQVVVVLASPSGIDYPPIRLDRELQRLEAVLNTPLQQSLLHLDVIRGHGTLDQLRARLRRPVHILHVLCHGDQEPVGGGVLIFEDTDGAPEPVRAEQLGMQLHKQRGQIQLVLLNACLGTLPADEDPHSSVGAALLRGGVPAVIAMQFELAEDAAVELARVFYAELVSGAPVDLALTEARQHLSGRYRSRLDWAVPVLFLRSDDGTLFDVAGQAAASAASKDANASDHYTRLENGTRQLLRQLGRESGAYTEALVHRQRLTENITQTRRFGDTPALSATRATIVERLNELAQAELSIPFRQLCMLPPLSEPEPTLIDQGALKRLWLRAQTAYTTRDWERAARLLRQVAATDPNYETVQAMLAEALRQHSLHPLYRQACEQRDEEQWQAVLDLLAELDRQQPGYPDAEGLRAWAEARRRRASWYSQADTARGRGDWAAVVAAIEALLAEFPSEAEARALLAQANDQQAQASRRQAEQPHSRTRASRDPRARFGAPLLHIEAGEYDAALDLLAARLQQDDRDAAILTASLIERPDVPFKLRLRAAHLVERAGDPRRGVCTITPAWCSFGGGRYLIATQADSSSDVAVAARRVRVKAFRIARYPITVAQYRRFQEDPSGYANQRWWTAHGWAWKQDPAGSHPRLKAANHREPPHQPVTDVSWYEAAAFCAWLSERWRAAGWLRGADLIRLPTEAEWEVAAMADPQRSDMRAWRPPSEAIWQNVAEAGIGRPSAVGLFPHGSSPGGAYDMAGNVWEWCASHYDDYPHDAGRRREDFQASDTGPVARGGAYNMSNSSSGWHARKWFFAHMGYAFLGFRVALVTKGLFR